MLLAFLILKLGILQNEGPYIVAEPIGMQMTLEAQIKRTTA